MKNMRKLASLLLALALVLSLSVTAFADEETDTDPAPAQTYTITITGAKPGHTFCAYQIFSGDLHDATLSNIKWGDGQTTYTVGDDATAEAEAWKTDEAALAAVKALTLDETNKHTSTYDKATTDYTIGNLSAGYYLVKDTEGSLGGENAAYTDYILMVVDNATSAIKSSVPTIEKKVTDINDSTQAPGKGDSNQDSADYDIGDHVPFHIHIKLNNHLESYDTYKLIVTDTLSKGLTYDAGTINIWMGDDTVSADNYDLETVVNADGSTTMTITFKDIMPLKPKSYGNLTIDYTATLNENAVIGSAGNPNTVNLQFSNNPDNAKEFGKTPDDKVTVFTFKVVVNKVDKDYNPLKGAEFTLFKSIHGTTEWKLVKTISGDDTTTFEFTGLDDGTYRLVETKTPSGYNTIAPAEFTVTASHEIQSDDPRLTALTGTMTSGTITFTAEEENGALKTDVVNKAGATLPETGGMGTTMIYVVGGILVLAAVVLLVTKKRMANAE